MILILGGTKWGNTRREYVELGDVPLKLAEASMPLWVQQTYILGTCESSIHWRDLDSKTLPFTQWMLREILFRKERLGLREVWKLANVPGKTWLRERGDILASDDVFAFLRFYGERASRNATEVVQAQYGNRFDVSDKYADEKLVALLGDLAVDPKAVTENGGFALSINIVEERERARNLSSTLHESMQRLMTRRS